MRNRCLVRPCIAALAACLATTSPRAWAAPPQPVAIGYLQLKNDPRYQPPAAYARLDLPGVPPPFEGAVLGVQDALADQPAPVDVKLQRSVGKDAAGLGRQLTAMAAAGTKLFLVDAPGDVVAALEKPAAAAHVLLFNVSATEDALRGADCSPLLFNVVPSRRMLTDALAQFLANKHWTRVLVLTGSTPADARRAAAFGNSARKFGLTVVATRTIDAGRQARVPALATPEALTSGLDYDAVFVADSDGRFGLELPFAVALPRPVVGDGGLSATAWAWSYQGGGAPALTLRFAALTGGRHMEGADYAAWLAVEMIVAAVRKTHDDPDAIAAYLRAKTFAIGDAKGGTASFRAADNQLRQGILLTTSLWTVAAAPLPGFTHKGSDLDTLGDDPAASACMIGK